MRISKNVKKLLIDRDLTVTALAKQIGVGRLWVSQTIHCHWRAIPTRRKIAKALNLPYSRVWLEPEPQAKENKAS